MTPNIREESINSYRQTVQYLYDLQYSGIKLGLNNIKDLLEEVGHPEKKWPAVHLAGSNGKGSTAAFIATVLAEAGYRVGLYTSPHLIDFSERIRINNRPVGWERIVEYTRQLKPTIDRLSPTFFEATTAIAFRYFADEKIDIAVVETGLGGRLDATNLVQPLSTAITSISMEHKQFLGDSLEKIAAEKAGIIKKNVPCFCSPQPAEVLTVIEKECRRQNAPLEVLDPEQSIKVAAESFAGSNFSFSMAGQQIDNLEIGLAGRHQVINAALAVRLLHNLPGFSINQATIRDGLKRTRWPGRLEVIRHRPLTILDVAHNPHGFRQVFRFLAEHAAGKNIWLLMGLAKDKDFRAVVDILKHQPCRIGLIRDFSEKALPADILADEIRRHSLEPQIFDTIESGLRAVYKQMKPEDLILIIGSHYLAEKFYQKYKNVDLFK